MLGQNPIFIPGPTNIPDRIRKAINLPMEDMRAPDFPEFVHPLLADLKTIFRMADGEVFVFPSSGTGGWEAALTNTLSPGDKVLNTRLGQFSLLWSMMCERLGLEVVNCDVTWGEGVPVKRYAEILAADTRHEIKAVLVCHNETATGVTSDVAAVREAMDACGHPALLLVDGISSIASIDFRMAEWGVDIAVAGSQKGFMLPAGLAMVAVSEKALEAGKSAKLPRCYFAFDWMLDVNRQGYFPYTPATTLLRGLRESIDMLTEEGLENVFARHHRMAEGVRRAVDAWGLSLCAAEPRWYSDTVSAICVPGGVDSGAVVKVAYETYGLSLGVGLTQVAGKVFRIGHLGQVTDLMLVSAIAGAEMAMNDAGVSIAFGSGVAAAQAWYAETSSLALADAAV
ncbi:MAG: aminotransferase class V-fold PLP-dependent enzyme [Rhodospirillales bacterium]|nr:aminotransferase class V-fold PLP-dependent enzyme [Rhodospirillales bacterium]